MKTKHELDNGRELLFRRSIRVPDKDENCKIIESKKYGQMLDVSCLMIAQMDRTDFAVYIWHQLTAGRQDLYDLIMKEYDDYND